jgi:PilZ domain
MHDRQARRAVDLKGNGILSDGTTCAFTIVNLSYDGCMIATTASLGPGEKLKLSVEGAGGSIEAVVRWYKEGQAGLRFDPGEDRERAQKPRQHVRIELPAELSLRRLGRDHYQTRLFDLTPTGCKVEFVERPRVDERLWVKFAGLDSIEADVRWVDGFFGGLEFVRPIYPAVFDILLVRLNEKGGKAKT